MARSENPALSSARLRERAADVSLASARGEYAPTLSLNANWGGYTNQLTDDESLLAGELGQKRGPCFQAEQIKAIVGQPSDSHVVHGVPPQPMDVATASQPRDPTGPVRSGAGRQEQQSRTRRPCSLGVAVVGDTGFEPVTPRM